MITAIVLAGGVGTRLGSDIPKQYIRVNCKMILTYALEKLIASDRIDGIRIVAAKEWQEEIRKDLEENRVPADKLKGFSLPGESRQYSILNALEDIRRDAERTGKNTQNLAVLIHDAARPLLSEKLIRQLADTVFEGGHTGAMPVLPMKDTVYMSEDGSCVSALLDRKQIFAGQAPEIFLFNPYYEANRKLHMEGMLLKINGSTEPAIIEGLDVALVEGDETNFKITTREDLTRFQELVQPMLRGR